ncbi:MAG: hypothetical protein ACSLEZ_04160 [Thiobacillus sp.]
MIKSTLLAVAASFAYLLHKPPAGAATRTFVFDTTDTAILGTGASPP